MIDVFFQSLTQAYSEKENLSGPNRSQTYDIPITSSDALPLHRYDSCWESSDFIFPRIISATVGLKKKGLSMLRFLT